MYASKIENNITFRINSGYILELLIPKTMELLGSKNKNINKDKNDENLPLLQIPEVVLINSNVVNNDYQQDLRILYTFAPNKLFSQLLEISSTNLMFSKTFNSHIEIWLPIKIVNLWK